MTVDHEIDAMGAVSKALEKVDDEAKARILDWAIKRFAPTVKVSAAEKTSNGDAQENSVETGDFEAFVDLFDRANPGSGPQRALVGGYWFQIVQGADGFKGQEVNNALKDIGHGVGNITEALDALQSRTPALVRQIAKTGRSKQARKTYKLTQAGVRDVRRMLNSAPEGES